LLLTEEGSERGNGDDHSRSAPLRHVSSLLTNTVLTIALALLLAACGTGGSLKYTPPGQVQTAATPSIGVVTAVDQRKEAPNRLATIMGSFGNPLKWLDTAKPVKDEVADAFTEGLRARGLLRAEGQAPFQLTLVIRKFDADMIVGRTARIDMTMTVLDQAGRSVFEDTTVDSESDTKFFQTGVFADIEDLRALSITVLNRSVNRLLDNPAFRAAIARSSPPAPPAGAATPPSMAIPPPPVVTAPGGETVEQAQAKCWANAGSNSALKEKCAAQYGPRPAYGPPPNRPAAPTSTANTPPVPPPSVITPAKKAQIDLLERLRDNGSLTSDQFEVERAKIILAPAE
jgi:hypothetical protein